MRHELPLERAEWGGGAAAVMRAIAAGEREGCAAESRQMPERCRTEATRSARECPETESRVARAETARAESRESAECALAARRCGDAAL